MTAPIIYIDGHRIAPTYTYGEDTVALAGVTIPWGKETLLEQPSPHAATIELLELDEVTAAWRHGTWIGQRVQAYLGDTCLLDGEVTAQESEQRRVLVRNRGRQAIVTTLTITDTWGILEGLVPPGTWQGAPLRGTGGAVTGSTWQPWGRAGWHSVYTWERLADIAAMITPHLIPKITVPTESWRGRDRGSTVLPKSRQQGVPATDLVSLAELLRRAYAATAPLGWAEIEPGVTIRQASPLSGVPVYLRQQNDRISLVSGQAIHIDPSVIETDDDTLLPTIDADGRIGYVSIAISEIERRYLPKLVNASTGVTIREEQVDEKDESTALQVRVPGGNGTRTEYAIPAAADAGWIVPRPSSEDSLTQLNVLDGYDAAVANVKASAEQLAYLNDKMLPPPLIAHGVTELTTTVASRRPIILRGNRFAKWDAVASQYQLIGGVLTWTGDDWEHEINLAPVADKNRITLTSSEVWSPLDAPLANIDRSIYLLDLCLLNEKSKK